MEAEAIYALCEGDQDAATTAIVAEDEKRFLAAHPGWEDNMPQASYTEIKGKQEDSIQTLIKMM
jgi:hypothetical protein